MSHSSKWVKMDGNYGLHESEVYNGFDTSSMDYSLNSTRELRYEFSSWYPHGENVSGYYENSPVRGGESVSNATPIFVETTSAVPVTGTRVHINPNFHPRSNGWSNKERGSQRPASVYINPHWKQKSEATENIDFQGSSVLSRKTIFVNPKMLAQIQPQLFEGTANTLPVKVQASASKHAEFLASAPHHITQFKRENPVDSTVTLRGGVLPSLENCLGSSEKEYIQEKKSTQAKISMKPEHSQSSNLHIKCDTKSLPISTSVSSNLKVANLIRSKYKFVRNTTPQTNYSSPMKAVHVNVSRKVKRKFASCKYYKQVKREEWNRPSTSRYKLVNKSEATNHQPFSSQSFKAVLPDKLKRSANGNKFLKTRYKLVKNLALPVNIKAVIPPTSEAKRRKLNSRFKLVCINSSVVSSNCKSNALHGVLQPKSNSTTSVMLKSQFKLVRYTSPDKILPIRRVSRYRIVQASGSKFKIKGPQSSSKLIQSVFSGNVQYNSNLRHSWPYFYSNRIWRNRRVLPTSHFLVNKLKLHRLPRGSSKPQNSSMSTTKSKSNFLSIGGVLYQSTPTSLTRTHPCRSVEKVLHIRGCKFLLDSKGTTLHPLTDTSEVAKRPLRPLNRVDIGGVTFIRRGGNTLVRTNTHFTRSLLSCAKMKSIAMLTAKLRKNNQPCLIFNRFGKCSAHEKGKCWRVHDPRNISICQKFLQGRCEIQGCLLSHNVGPEKMPTCRYFLDGCCVRDNCPYLHVKLSAHAAICKQFLDGYCASGDMCKKRHFNICPDFEVEGKCPKGKYCPYPHPKAHKTKVKSKIVCPPASAFKKNAEEDSEFKNSTPQLSLNSNEQVSSSGKTQVNDHEVDKRQRYYNDSKSSSSKSDNVEETYSVGLREKRNRILKQIDHLKKMRFGVMSDSSTNESSDDDAHEGELFDPVDERPKIGILPAYIPLE